MLLHINKLGQIWKGKDRWRCITSIGYAIITIIAIVLLFAPIRHPAARYAVAFFFVISVGFGVDAMIRYCLVASDWRQLGGIPSYFALVPADALMAVVFILPFTNRLNQVTPFHGTDDLFD